MKRFLLICALGHAFLTPDIEAAQPDPKVAARIFAAATNSTLGFERLAQMCDLFGPRFSGTTNLEGAIDWTLAKMREDGFASVRGEPVEVPKWVRGKESLEMLEPRPQALHFLGLGGSIGTGGITAEVLTVRSFEELTNRASTARGKIVLFNAPFTTYGETVQYRYSGAVQAAKSGAVASLVRSVTPHSLQTPHTGAMGYETNVTKIPHGAITVEDAEMIQRMQDRGQRVSVRLQMEAHDDPPAPSRDVVAELRGHGRPEEIVLVSGHIDSWDVGTGAMDDGGGCLIAWESARLLKELGIPLRRTVRIVFWTNEENGMAGAKTYRATHATELKQHVLAIESDEGCFDPREFALQCNDATFWKLRALKPLFANLKGFQLVRGEPTSDLSYLRPEVPTVDLHVQPDKYFWYHHTAADTIDKLDRNEFNRCVAATALMIYGASESDF